MADVNAEIGVNIDTSNALAQLKALQREIARFHTSVAKSSDAAALAQRDLQRNFLNGVNAIQGFSAELRTVRTTAENFTDSLEKNKFSMREYFRYSAASTKTFGRFFKTELDTINKVALDNVKRLQTQYIKMGRDASGAMKAIAIMPTKLDLTDLTTQTQIAAQKQALFNQLVKQGSTNLLNFGKNTQWAGRQLMVGFTLPLIGLGSAASKTFMEMETAAIKFRKVYGDLFTPAEERDQAFSDIQALGKEFTKYGIAVAETINLAAEAAAAGFQGLDLQRQVTEATRLQVLGQVDQQKSLETTISLQNAFRMSSADLADAINFLNAVENQTVVSLDDITTAIPKAAPIVKELGGDVKDLAFFMAAMKEGGINASEGANALKSGLASLINPSDKARGMLKGFGIDIDAIVEKNVGNVKQTVIDFAFALDDLSSLSRQRAIEQLFGKFQQARLSALFSNVIRDGNQASRVLDLAGTSVEELASLAEGELGITANSAMNKFRSSVENLKASLAPIGQLFLEILTPFIQNIGDLFDKFNGLSAGTKKVIGALVIGIGAIAPVVLMTVGLFANFVANGIKGLMLLRNGYLRLTGQSQILSEQTNYLTVEQQQAVAAAASLEQSHMNLKQVFTGEAEAVRQLVAEYQRMIAAQNTAATRFPGMMVPGFKTKNYAKGVVSVPGPKGAGDIVPAMLSPGEAVISASMNQKYAPLVQGIIADNIPGYADSIRSVPGKISKRFTFFDKARRESIAEEFGLGQGERLRLPLSTGAYDYSVAGVMAPRNVNRPPGPRVAGMATGMTQEYLQSPLGRASFMANVQVGLEDLGTSSEELSRILDLVGPTLQTAIDQFDGSTESWVTAANNAVQTINEFDQLTEQQKEVIRQRVAPIDPQDYIVSGSPMVEVSSTKAKQRVERNTAAYGADRISEILAEKGFDASGFEYSHMPGFERTSVPIEKVAPPSIAGRTLTPGQIQKAQEIAAEYEMARAEHRRQLEALKLEIDAAEGPIRESGRRVGDAAIEGVAQGTQSASPSKEAIQQGRNVGDGFEQGILEGMDDASLAASKVKQSAIQGFQGAAPGLVTTSIVGPSTPLSARPQAADDLGESLDDLTENVNTASAAATTSGARLAKFNDRMMAGSFALSGITGMMSLFGQNMGGATNVIFKISSAMFALQGVVQALTSAKLLELAATRASTVAGAMQGLGRTAAGKQIGGSVAGLFTRGGGLAGFAKNILTAGKFALRFAGGIGLAITAVTAAVGIFKFFKNRAEENARKINGLGDAALLTAKKLTTLEEIFGISLAQSAADRFKYEGAKAAPALASDRRSRAEEIRQNKKFQEDFKNDIKSLEEATPEQAKVILETLAFELKARGASKEQIQALTDALRSEAGQTKVKLDFDEIDIGTKGGNRKLIKNIDDFLKKYKKALKNGLLDETKRQANASGVVIASTFKTLQLNLESGKITADQYAKSVGDINSQILALPNGAAKAAIVKGIFKGLGEEAQKAVKGISDVNTQLILATAISLELADQATIDALKSPNQKTREAAIKRLYDLYNKYLNDIGVSVAEQNDANDDGNESTEKGLTLQEKLIKVYQKQQARLEKRLNTLQKTNDEISRQNELVQNQMDLQNQITEAKISGNYLEAASLVQQKMSDLAEFNRETKEIDIQNQIDRIQERISQLENKAKVTSAEKRLLKLENKPSGKPSGSSKKAPAPSKPTDKDYTESLPKPKQDKKTLSVPKPIAGFNGNIENYGLTGTAGYYIVFDTTSGRWTVKKSSSIKPKDITLDEYKNGQTRYASGGMVSGPGTATSDSIPAWLSDGEYVFSAKAVSNAGGPNAVSAMHEYFKNARGLKGGGPVSKYFARIAKQNKEYKGFGSGLLNAGPSASIARIFGGQRQSGDILNALGTMIGLPIGRLAGMAGSKVAGAFPYLKAFGGQMYSGLLSRLPGAAGLSRTYHGGPSGISAFKKQDLRGWNLPGTYLTQDPIAAAQYAGDASKRAGISNIGSIYKFAAKAGEKISVLNMRKKATKELKDSLIGIVSGIESANPEATSLIIKAIQNSKTVDEAVAAARSFKLADATYDFEKFASIKTATDSKIFAASGMTSESFDLIKNFRMSKTIDRLSGLKRNLENMGGGLGGVNMEDDIQQWIITNASKFVSKEMPINPRKVLGATPKLQSMIDMFGLRDQAIAPYIAQQKIANWMNYFKEFVKNKKNPGSVPDSEMRVWAENMLQEVKYSKSKISQKVYEFLTGEMHPFNPKNIFGSSTLANGGYINAAKMASLPQFKNGISNVPYEMAAILHPNERVLTKEENRRYMSGQGITKIDAEFNITGSNADEIANKVMVKLTNLQNKNNKSNKVNI